MSATNSAIEKYIYDSLDFFFQESKRLQSKEPVERFKLIVDAFVLIQSKLGGLEHEGGLDSLKKEIVLVKRDIIKEFMQSWRDFWKYRTLASHLNKQEQREKITGQLYLKDLKKSIDDVRSINPPLAEAAEEMYEALDDIGKIDLSFASTWRDMSWIGLWIDMKQFSVYMQYLSARIRVFLQFHSYIFIVPIFLAGIVFSFVSKSAAEALISVIGYQSLWITLIFLIFAGAIKKYVIEKKLKKLQKQFETKLYRFLSIKLLFARTLALQVRTLNEK